MTEIRRLSSPKMEEGAEATLAPSLNGASRDELLFGPPQARVIE